MGRIHLLGDDVINKIAAGEVVERPASVVKELVENALDAGATNIDVALELGGARSIAVTDDGSGMDDADAEQALRRHATSKIAAADDLFSIKTMGFRGEALASVASVSRFSLATRQPDTDTGIKLTVQGGESPQKWPWNGPAGTTVVVENLFYNIPARAKFMKAPATELSHCLELVHAFALCHPRVGFTLRHNGREQFRAPAAQAPAEAGEWLGEAALRERAKAVLGKDAANLQYLRSNGRQGDLEALASPPGIEKASGKSIYTFVNGRWVKDRVLRYGILRGYHSHLLKGRFPVVVMHLRLDPALVDVNVHPAKTEVRFQYPDEVQGLIALAIRNEIREASWATPAAVPVFSEASRPGAAAPGARRLDSAPARPVGITQSTRSFGGARAGAAGAGAGAPTPAAGGRVTDKASLDALLGDTGAAAPAAGGADADRATSDAWLGAGASGAGGRETCGQDPGARRRGAPLGAGDLAAEGAGTPLSDDGRDAGMPQGDDRRGARMPLGDERAERELLGGDQRGSRVPLSGQSSAWAPMDGAPGAGARSRLSRTAANASGESVLPAPTGVFGPAPAARPGGADQDAILGLTSDGEAGERQAVPWADLQYLGAFDRCYLLFAADGRLLAVDQHAFHERVLYERLVRDRGLLTRSQPLLVPESLELSPTEVAGLRARWPQLSARGFDYQAEGETTVLVKAVPAILAGRDLGDLFADLGRDLAAQEAEETHREPGDSNAEMARLILAKAACHAAVRAGEELPPNELRQLLAEAGTVDFFHNCPHGRRVFKWWTRAQVARWFDR